MTTLRAMPRASVLLSWFMLAIVLGGHWGILQVVAWTNMALQNSSHMSIGEAMIAAVDGNDPCRMCKAIQKATQLDEQPSATPMPRLQKLHQIDAILPTYFIHAPVLTSVFKFPPMSAVPHVNYSAEPLQRPPISVS